jgi:arylsulfatase A-like enzyme
MYAMAHLPASRGFDTSIGYLAGGEDYYTKVAEGGACKNTTVQPLDLWDGFHPANDTAYQHIYSAFIYAARATQIIAAHDPEASPLFLYLAMQNVHWPLQVPLRFLSEDKSTGKVCTAHQTPETCPGRGGDDCGCQHSCYCNRRLKLGMVAVLDEVVGNVTDALKARGMWARTVFWMVSDNGGETMDAGNNLPLKGMT